MTELQVLRISTKTFFQLTCSPFEPGYIYFLVSSFPGEQGKWVHFAQFSQQALLKRGIVELLMTADAEEGVINGYIQGGTNLNRL